MSKGYKQVPRTGTARQAIEEGFSEIESLGEECREAQENFPNSDHPKAEAFGEAADTLENAAGNAPDTEHSALDTECSWTDTVPRDKRRSPARWARLESALTRLRAVNEVIEAIPKFEEDTDLYDIHDMVEEVLGGLDGGVEFPGMFG